MPTQALLSLPRRFIPVLMGAWLCLPAGVAMAAETRDDPHLWLEEVDGERALAWVRARNRESEARLAQDPRFAAIEDAARAVYAAGDRIPYAGQIGERVLNFWQDADHVRGLLRRAPLAAYLAGAPDWEVLLDLDALAEQEGENWVYKGAECLMPEARRCLLMLSRGGGDAVVVREFDLDAKLFVDHGFISSEAKQSLNWLDADAVLVSKAGEGFRETDSGYGAELRLWRRGQPLTESRLLLQAPTNHIGVYGMVVRTANGRFPFALRRPTFFTEELFHLGDALRGAGPPHQLPLPADLDWRGLFAGHVIGLTRSEWRAPDFPVPAGALFAAPLDDLLAGRLTGVRTLARPSGRRAIADVRTARSRLYVSLSEDVRERLVEIVPEGEGWTTIASPLPQTGSLALVSAVPDSDLALVNHESFLAPDTLYAIEPGQPPRTVAQLPERFAAQGFAVRQAFATSQDGTRVPYFLVAPKDSLAGVSKSPAAARAPLPTLLYGYGGFEIALTPSYLSPLASAWLEAGGAYAIANIRGGGEYGPKWHQAALKANRQRAFADFAAVAEHLIESGLTRPDLLGIYGGSNGGLLVGAAFTQRPELYGAVVCAVPLLDMLRYHKLLAGASWVGEYGDPDNPAARQWLAAYSPYHNVRAQADYPPVFLTTSTKDDRVHPGHARKMAAELKAQGHQVLYYENTEGGHSAAANLAQLARRDALVATFLMQALMGDGQKAVATGAG